MWRLQSLAPVAIRLVSRTQVRAINLRPLDTFARRHIGASDAETKEMLKVIGKAQTLDEFTSSVVPKAIALNKPLGVGEPLTESEFMVSMKNIASKNRPDIKSAIGMGYYDTVTPNVILRNVIENPQWYTPYTPYQAEVAQGRLESLLNFQTIVTDLTGMPVANASLLDEGTAAAEAMGLAFRGQPAGENRTIFLVDRNVHPQVLSVLETRAEPLGITIKVCNVFSAKIGQEAFGVLLQYPGSDGTVEDITDVANRAHAVGAQLAVGTDLLALCVLKTPGEMGADVAYGSAQRFGVPMGFGGPHAAFFAAQRKHLRSLPGRVVGVTRDSRGKPALRMALQTREQHIRRERATSNICTAQALLANTAAMYAVYHGPQGLRAIAERTHALATILADGLAALGFKNLNKLYFDTLKIDTGYKANDIVKSCLDSGYNIRDYGDLTTVGLSVDETWTITDIEMVLSAFADFSSVEKDVDVTDLIKDARPALSTSIPLRRTSSYLDDAVFNSYHAEHEMLRYIMRLGNKDIGLTQSMIPLGSCTMKLNATTEMIPVTWPEMNKMHPFAPLDQTQGYQEMVNRLSTYLAKITGFQAVTFQPNSGAQGEFAGLLTIRAYLQSIGQGHRNICLIPASAHGTNPASAAMVGMRVTSVKCLPNGSIDMADLRAKAEEHAANLACVMVTYPSTYGIFEEGVKEVCEIVHKNGGQVYMDGANMNAQVGLCRPGDIGADVCHLNLHKTFCIPHGGGGPGMGPIAVASHLAPFLPSHPAHFRSTVNPFQKAVGAVSSAPYSSASILPISFAYMEMMGDAGLKRSTQMAILAANYMKARLAPHYTIAFQSDQGYVAHELIIDVRAFKQSAGIEAIDLAKRLQDYGFHAPTVSWPLAGSLMIEPTESESKAEMDRYIDALISIRNEIREIEEGKADRVNNVLKNAPHTADTVLSSSWSRPYSREQAAYPAAWSVNNKYWPTVGRVDDVFGDRNVVCTCPSVEELEAIQRANDSKA